MKYDNKLKMSLLKQKIEGVQYKLKFQNDEKWIGPENKAKDIRIHIRNKYNL